ncbi:hypothetical protein [Candidatus Paracaedibacter symbiosus]|uniref:hypothetical protein n=1 Tax=Candidatus Paracaedibacter symbiosus TaxID=244582 RepID=UPI0018DDBF9D|nr:hypothetical protein [Candidatus Paracaedibacter symbiosus]
MAGSLPTFLSSTEYKSKVRGKNRKIKEIELKSIIYPNFLYIHSKFLYSYTYFIFEILVFKALFYRNLRDLRASEKQIIDLIQSGIASIGNVSMKKSY